jgi:hypothetical protein
MATWRITMPALAVLAGVRPADLGDLVVLDPETARQAELQGWAELVKTEPKPKRKRKA